MTKRRAGARPGGWNDLEAVLAEDYGVPPDYWEPAVVAAAAERLMWQIGVPTARHQLARVNEQRVAAGVAPVVPRPGHPLSWAR